MSITDAPPTVVTRGPRADHAHPPSPPRAAAHEEHDDLPKDLKKPRVITVIAVGLMFLALLGALYVLGYLPHERALKQAQADAALMTSDVNLVAVTHALPAAGAKEIVLPCDIRPNQDTLVFPRASGYLKRLYVDIQDHVAKDQLLAEIDAPEVDAELLQAQAQLQQSRADVAKAQTDFDLAQRTYDRYKTADTGGNEFSRQELDERATARDQAKASVEQAQGHVAIAEASIRRLQVMQGFDKITAPFEGVITARNFDVGALLSPSDTRPLFHLQQSDKLRVFVNMPQVYATEIHIGQSAALAVRNYRHRTFSGTVARTAYAVNTNTRTMPFEIHFPNEDGALVPGMYGEVKLAVDSPPQALLIPVSAMLFNARGTQVAIVKDGRVHFQDVVVGRDLGTELEVLDGISAASVIITNPGERLVEGSAVKVADNAAEAPIAAK